MATQNPIEYEGTFPLPEAQLDRFLMRITLGHPTPEQEVAILDAQQFRHPIESIEQVVTVEELLTGAGRGQRDLCGRVGQGLHRGPGECHP